MKGDFHVRFCGGLGVKFPWSTRRAKMITDNKIFKNFPYLCKKFHNAHNQKSILAKAGTKIKNLNMEVAIKKPKKTSKRNNDVLSLRQIRNRVGDGWAIFQNQELTINFKLSEIRI